MKVAVVGGTGSLGKPLVAELAARGDEVLVLVTDESEGEVRAILTGAGPETSPQASSV